MLQLNVLLVHLATTALKVVPNSQQDCVTLVIIVQQDKPRLNQLLMFAQQAAIVKSGPVSQLHADQATIIHLQE